LDQPDNRPHATQPSRSEPNRIHGRVYRITYEDRPLLKPVKIAGEPIEKVLDVLKEPEDRVRYRARIELAARDTDQVIPALKEWVAGLDPKDANYEHHMLEALWLQQNHNVVNEDLLKRELGSSDFHVRAAATRVLCYWRDRIPDALIFSKSWPVIAIRVYGWKLCERRAFSQYPKPSKSHSFPPTNRRTFTLIMFAAKPCAP